jgi:hypothetical protein
MPRACSICSRGDIAAINVRIVSGTPLNQVAGEFSGTGTSSLSRHTKHLAKRVLSEARDNLSNSTIDLLEAISEALQDVRAVRATALATGNAPLLLRAAQSTESIAGGLLERLGPDGDTGVIEAMREADSLVRAVAYVARRDANAGRIIADRMGADGHPDIADAIRRLLPTTAQILETREA